MQTKAEDFIRSILPKGPFIGVHMRNGVDWSRACEHVVNAPTLFASAQCLGKLYHIGIQGRGTLVHVVNI